ACGEEPLRCGERARRLRHDRQGTARREQPVGAVPLYARKGGGRLVRARDHRRHAAAAGRDPGAGRCRARAECAPALGGPRAAPPATARRFGGAPQQTRLAMLLGVLPRHAGIATWEQDVFVNAVGGVRIAEPAADLAVTLAVVSSLTDRPIAEKVAVFGEIGL